MATAPAGTVGTAGPPALTPPVPPDLAAVKARQQATWASGDYAVIGTTLQIVGERLCEALHLRAGERVLDVAAGNGNATLAAARRFAEVTSTDYVDAPLERGRERAASERLHRPRLRLLVCSACGVSGDDAPVVVRGPRDARAQSPSDAARTAAPGGARARRPATPVQAVAQPVTLRGSRVAGTVGPRRELGASA